MDALDLTIAPKLSSESSETRSNINFPIRQDGISNQIGEIVFVPKTTNVVEALPSVEIKAEKFECENCYRRFVNEVELQSHTQNRHCNATENSTDIKIAASYSLCDKSVKTELETQGFRDIKKETVSANDIDVENPYCDAGKTSISSNIRMKDYSNNVMRDTEAVYINNQSPAVKTFEQCHDVGRSSCSRYIKLESVPSNFCDYNDSRSKTCSTDVKMTAVAFSDHDHGDTQPASYSNDVKLTTVASAVHSYGDTQLTSCSNDVKRTTVASAVHSYGDSGLTVCSTDVKLKTVSSNLNDVSDTQVATCSNDARPASATTVKPFEFECVICRQLFSCEAELLEHGKTHLSATQSASSSFASNLLSCYICNKNFADTTSLEGHMKRHMDALSADTNEDEMRDSNDESNRNSNGNSNPNRDEFPTKGYYTCLICEKIVSTAKSSYHLRMHSAERSHVCPVCGKSFKKKEQLDVHLKIHSGEKPYECSECAKKFTHSNSLVLHLRTHTGEKPYLCSICGMSFAVNSTWHQHMLTHSGEKSHACPICDKKFARKTTLARHMRGHGGDSQYECHLCRKRFLHKHSLNVHLNTHGEKLFECTLCGKKLTTKYGLKLHMETACSKRTDAKESYPCKCGKSYLKKSSLLKHMKLHEDGTIPLECSFCDKKFTANSDIKKHMERHSGELKNEKT